MLIVLCFTAVANFLIGFLIGYLARYRDEKFHATGAEKEIYCHGYEDGFYFGWGTYEPELFKRETAEKAYFEYKGIKHGPTKH